MERKSTSPFDANVRNHPQEAELDAFLASQRKTGVVLQRIFPPTAFPQVRSRLGGLPQLPAGLKWPIGVSYGDVVPMHFLAQIDCAEVPRVEPDMPEEGMLFFFAVSDEEMIWNDGDRQQRVRVLYAPAVAEDQPEREPPGGLRPIHDDESAESAFGNRRWLLLGEDGPRLYARWPLVARRMDTWPDSCALPAGHPEFGYERYHERLAELRLGAAVAATGQMRREGSVPDWAASFTRWFGYQTDFPQAGILADRLARFIGNERSRVGHTLIDFPDVQQWVQRAADIGWDDVLDQTTRQAFREWVITCIEEGGGRGKIDERQMADLFTQSLLSAVAYAGSSEKAAVLIPKTYYADLEGKHVPFSDGYGWRPDGRRQVTEVRVHQMLGHVPFIQNCGPEVDGDAVCLLQLATDDSIDLTFGDCGQATFWITREDLVNRRFDQVAAVVESG